jgi:hypothetical protein
MRLAFMSVVENLLVRGVPVRRVDLVLEHHVEVVLYCLNLLGCELGSFGEFEETLEPVTKIAGSNKAS